MRLKSPQLFVASTRVFSLSLRNRQPFATKGPKPAILVDGVNCVLHFGNPLDLNHTAPLSFCRTGSTAARPGTPRPKPGLFKANWFEPVFVPRHETPSGLSGW